MNDLAPEELGCIVLFGLFILGACSIGGWLLLIELWNWFILLG